MEAGRAVAFVIAVVELDTIRMRAADAGTTSFCTGGIPDAFVGYAGVCGGTVDVVFTFSAAFGWLTLEAGGAKALIRAGGREAAGGIYK